jgi:hypothetical protein
MVLYGDGEWEKIRKEDHTYATLALASVRAAGAHTGGA